MTIPALAGRRVLLRPAAKADATARFDLGVDAEVHRMFGGSRSGLQPMTSERAEAWLSALDAHPHAWIIEVAGRLVGEIRLDTVDEHDRRARLAVGIFKTEDTGQGFGTEAIRLAVDYAFGSLALHRIGLRVVAFNERAIRAYLKCGFVVEGRERESAFVDGEWHDDLIMGLLAPEPSKGA